MSSTEITETQDPRKSPQNPSQVLTDPERTTMQKYLSNPLDFPPEFRTWLEGFMETVIPSSAAISSQIVDLAFPVGEFRFVVDDLTANTGVYEWVDPDNGLKFLYCNGAAASQATYATLYAKWGASKWGADSGGNFLLPDTRGRSLWMAGTNAATDLGDNDGVALASRQPKHTHSDSLSVSVSGTFASSSHTHTTGGGSSSYTADQVENQSGAYSGAAHTHSTGGPSGTSSASGSISGSVGSGMAGSDAVAHIVIGSLVVRF